MNSRKPGDTEKIIRTLPFTQPYLGLTTRRGCMARIASREVFEAEELLEEVESWSAQEIEELPKFYQEKARELQRLTQQGDE